MESAIIFKNSSVKGAFGEYVYKTYAISRGYRIDRLAIREIDFRLTDLRDGSVTLVDVKTTSRQFRQYSGTRHIEHCCYETIFISQTDVHLIADPRSPFAGDAVHLGDVSKWIAKWESAKNINTRKPKASARDNYREWRQSIAKQIKEAMETLGISKTRVIWRGKVSKTRWSSSPDNLPGSTAQISKYSHTVFIQTDTTADGETVHSIVVIDHALLSEAVMKDAVKRQRDKGILKVLDIEKYTQNNPGRTYRSIEELEKRYLKQAEC